MCLVSDKIKFCTCVRGSFEELPHYWLLYRFNKNKNLQCIGLPVMPFDFNDSNYALNVDTLNNRLNEPDAFDTPIEFKSNDQIEIVLNNLSDDTNRMTFCFRYKRGKWAVEEYEPFELMNRYDEYAFGKVEE